MKTFQVLLAVGLALLLAACASTSKPVVVEPVGPPPPSSYDTTPKGYLQVFTATEGHNSGDVYYFPHTAYSIFSTDGKLVQRVRNALGMYDEQPEIIRLPADNYEVHAEGDHYLFVVVPVVIETGKRTTVHLDGDWQGPALGKASEADLVKLPNGEIVGWRAAAAK
jgi:hypothetical protein